MARYYLTNTAVDDLENIWNYILEEWSESQTDTYYQGQIDCFQNLAVHPKPGKNYEALATCLPGFRFNKHLVFYRILKPDLIEITRILYNRMDLKVRFRDQ